MSISVEHSSSQDLFFGKWGGGMEEYFLLEVLFSVELLFRHPELTFPRHRFGGIWLVRGMCLVLKFGGPSVFALTDKMIRKVIIKNSR